MSAPRSPCARGGRLVVGLGATALLVWLGASLLAANQAPPQMPPADSPPASPARPSQGSAFRAGIEVVSLNVTVIDGTGRYVTDLDEGDFQVFEDGARQDVTFFNKTNLPIAMSLLIDSSASMESKLQTAQEAAIGFARRLRSQDLAEVLDFDSRVTTLQPFTNRVADLEQAIRRTSPGGSTSLYNALYIALKDLKKVMAHSTSEIRRQAVIVLSDGEDTSSLLSFEEVLDLAKRSETAIYTVGLRTADPTPNRGFKEADFVLRQLAQETGGRSFFPQQVSDLNGVYGQIAEELSNQYIVGYTSHNPRRDGGWRRVVVRIDRPSLTPRTKLGYFAPTSH